MYSFESALKAFQQAQLSFEQLLAITVQISAQPAENINLAEQLLNQAYQSDSLAAAEFSQLQAALQEKTRVLQAKPFPAELSNPVSADVTLLLKPETRQIPADDATLILESRQPPLQSTDLSTDQTLVFQPHAIAEQKLPTQHPAATAGLVNAGDIPTTQSTTASLLRAETLVEDGQQTQRQTEIDIGSILKNRFELKELLGVGGMGKVFKAIDIRKVEAADKEPYIALKVLNQDFQADPMALMALQRESKKAQTLSHPNIIKVYDFDRDGAHVFMSMEYLQGKPLSQLIREHADQGLPFKQAWPIIRAMAEALAYAHRHHIVHSDFKPGNVFITDHHEVRVLDFGIACAIGRNDQHNQDATVFDARALGAMTPAYASLEQLQNSPPDPRDDIYALACVSYELLTGKHPFGRLSAEKALEVNLQLKPVKGLSRRQWKDLQNALALKQAQRCPNLEAFIKNLGPRSPWFYGVLVMGVMLLGLLATSVYFSLHPQQVSEAPPIAIELSPEQQQKIQDLLDLAGIHFDVGYLTAPTGSNALWAYQEVLKIDPYNKAATDGINKIADTLEQQAWEAYEKGDRTTAIKKIQDGLEANPAHQGLLRIQGKLKAGL